MYDRLKNLMAIEKKNKEKERALLDDFLEWRDKNMKALGKYLKKNLGVKIWMDDEYNSGRRDILVYTGFKGNNDAALYFRIAFHYMDTKTTTSLVSILPPKLTIGEGKWSTVENFYVQKDLTVADFKRIDANLAELEKEFSKELIKYGYK